ncbi:S41 family peptidase [Maricaulis sp.]|uniref:S41 family peptidase n=1 Tax=Maricaulis sp. TaxID=1486257 RepID=UPI0025BBA23A|nr:S41 family peptidase [Maricaulis sp.]
MIKRFTLCLALLATAPVQAQPPAPDPDPVERLFAPDIIRAEFDQLYAGLQAAHVDLFAATPRSVMDRHHAEIRAGFNAPLPRTEIERAFQTFTALARHAHARIESDGRDYGAYREAGGRVLPVNISIRAGRVLVESHASGVGALQPGDEILAFNGMPNTVWMPRLLRHVSAETPRFGQTLLEFQLRRLVWQEWPELDTASLDVRHADGSQSRITLPFRNSEEMEIAGFVGAPQFRLDTQEARLIGDDIAYLRPGPFYNTMPGGDVWDPTGFVAFVDESFADFQAASADTLIIDLRDNPGGDNSFSDPMLAWIADRPFRFASHFTVRVSPQSTAANQARLDAMETPGGMSALYAELYAQSPDGALIEIDLPWTEPRPSGDRFDGAVYVLVNRYSFSNAVTVAAMVQDYGFGSIVGETTADMATTYGAMETFSLDTTGIRVAYPKAHIIRPDGVSESHPVTPDIALDMPDLRGTDDVVLDQLVDLIRNRVAD